MKGIFYNDFENSYIPHILKEVYIDKVYQPFFQGKKDLTVLEIGGNIGLVTSYFYPFCKRIVTVEPSKFHLELLNKSLEFNNMLDKVTVVPKAVSNNNGAARFYHSENVTMFSLRPEVNNKPNDVEEVETITIDKLFEETGLGSVDFMKLDCEGAESEIICGSGFEKVASKIKALTVEWHSWSNTSPNQLVNALSDYGFKVRQIPNDATLFYAER